MFKFLFSIFLFSVFFTAQIHIADAEKSKGWVPEDYKMETMGHGATQVSPSHVLPPLQYISPNIPLTDRDRHAIKLANDWQNSGPPPLQANGKVMYVYGASSPTVIGAPMQVSDVELQPGEKVNEVIVGDSARWMIDTAQAGDVTHILIKPMDAGLSTSAVITTDRRAYHIILKSQRIGHTPQVAFLYPGDKAKKHHAEEIRKAKEKKFKTADVAGRTTDLSKLNFAYAISGDASWKPTQVFDDGRQMFIKLPPKVRSGDAPIVLVRNGGQDILANFRMKNLTLLVDGVFPEAKLISGVGSHQQRITIRKIQ